MKLYLVRHGKSENRDTAASDSARRLTDQGRHDLRTLGKRLRGMGVEPGLFLASPYTRATETAVILRDILAPNAELETPDCLQPGAGADDVIASLKDHAPCDTLVAGHAPDMGEIAAGLICRKGMAEVQFKKAAVGIIEFDEGVALGAGTLTFLAQPRHLKGLS